MVIIKVEQNIVEYVKRTEKSMIFIDIIASLIIAILSGMGVGSAGLFIIYLVIAKNTAQITAQTLNLIFYILSCAVSLLLHIKQRKILKKEILLMIIAALPGVLIGSYIASVIDSLLAKRLFGGLLVFAGATSLINTINRIKRANSRSENM